MPLELISYKTFCELVADAYDEAPLLDPAAVPAYESLATHNRKMFKRMLSNIDVEFVDYDPYSSAEEMRADVERTNVLKVSTLHSEHPVFNEEDNVIFRAVHDYIVHLLTDKDFSQKGEVAAYNAHIKLLPPKAWPAAFTEIVGQACYFTVRGNFPTQKVAILPGFDYKNVGRVEGWLIEEKQLVPVEREPERMAAERVGGSGMWLPWRWWS